MAERKDSQRQRGTRTTEQVGGAPASKQADPKIAQLARALGNDALKSRMLDGNRSRDLMLEHIGDRLKTMREIQLREIALSHRGSHFPYWRLVADKHKSEYSAPEPTRWNEAARLYEDAAHHLARGDLKRGRTVLERAMREEQRAREKLTRLVFTGDLEKEPAGAVELPAFDSTEVSGACDLPPEIGLAKEIYHVTTEGPNIPNRGRATDPWWTMDEDEEEEEPGDAGSG